MIERLANPNIFIHDVIATVIREQNRVPTRRKRKRFGVFFHDTQLILLRKRDWTSKKSALNALVQTIYYNTEFRERYMPELRQVLVFHRDKDYYGLLPIVEELVNNNTFMIREITENV